MRPMDFEEFLWARGDDATVPLLRQAFASRRPLGERLNRRLMRDFRFYMLVGHAPGRGRAAADERPAYGR